MPLERLSLSRLSEAVMIRILGSGATRSKIREYEGRACSWQRPALFTNSVLGDLPLQSFLSLPCSVSVDQMTETYEEFLAGFVRERAFGRVDPMQHLADRLGFSLKTARYLFTNGKHHAHRRSYKAMLDMVLALAALVEYNHDVAVHSTADTYVVLTAEGWKFGVRQGRPVTNFKNAAPFDYQPLYRYDKGLRYKPRGKIFKSTAPNMYNELNLWVRRHSDEFDGEAAALIEGLTIIRCRSPYAYPDSILVPLLPSSQPEALLEAVSEARAFATSYNPGRLLRDILVPQFISGLEFDTLFGSSWQEGGLTQRRQDRWTQALDTLENRARDQMSRYQTYPTNNNNKGVWNEADWLNG